VRYGAYFAFVQLDYYGRVTAIAGRIREGRRALRQPGRRAYSYRVVLRALADSGGRKDENRRRYQRTRCESVY